MDEGFGSLDEESLQQAVRALSSLTEGNRLVGIISHVGELKEKIDRQILVKKTGRGQPGRDPGVRSIPQTGKAPDDSAAPPSEKLRVTLGKPEVLCYNFMKNRRNSTAYL